MTDNIKDTGDGGYHPHKHLEHGFKKFWRPLAAYIYLGICIFDFIGMPIYIGVQNNQVNTAAFREIRTLEHKEVQIKALEELDLGKGSWEPLTLMGGGLFHLSFGAILGVAAFTRGQEKKAAIESAPKLSDLDDEDI